MGRTSQSIHCHPSSSEAFQQRDASPPLKKTKNPQKLQQTSTDSASKGDFVVPRARIATRQKGLSRLWVPLFGIAFSLTFVLCRRTFPVLFINSSRLSSLDEPG